MEVENSLHSENPRRPCLKMRELLAGDRDQRRRGGRARRLRQEERQGRPALVVPTEDQWIPVSRLYTSIIHQQTFFVFIENLKTVLIIG